MRPRLALCSTARSPARRTRMCVMAIHANEFLLCLVGHIRLRTVRLIRSCACVPIVEVNSTCESALMVWMVDKKYQRLLILHNVASERLRVRAMPLRCARVVRVVVPRLSVSPSSLAARFESCMRSPPSNDSNSSSDSCELICFSVSLPHECAPYASTGRGE
jgi:hypothetical protein